MGSRNSTSCSLSVQANPRGMGCLKHEDRMFQAEAVFIRDERPKRSSRFCHLGHPPVSCLAVESANTKKDLDKWNFRARCLVSSLCYILGHKNQSLICCSKIAFSIVRLAELTRLDVSDVTWNYQPVIVWSSVEICVGIFCACLPVTAPLVAVFMRVLSGSEESYAPSSFGPSHAKRGNKDSLSQSFNKLEDDTAGLVTSRDNPMSIRQTTDIEVSHEDSIPLQTMS